MHHRFDSAHLDTWRREGGVLIQRFFTDDEVAAVRADFEQVFRRSRGAEMPLNKKQPGRIGGFHPTQFGAFEAIPFDCSPALNLIGVHPALVAFAKAALVSDDVYIYQCQAWAKYTGDADYDQPFHCDFSNHTLTVPADDAALNAVTILCYFTDVDEALGPMHYVTRTDSARIAGPEATFTAGADVQAQLARYERSSAAPAGSIFPYGIDIYHRGTNLTAPHGVRYAVMSCFKRAGNDAIGYHAWPFHHMKPWQKIFDHATPAQLHCFGVPLPGHRFWTQTTLRRAQARYPGWDLTPYARAL
jgi:hypothetical protein